MSIRRVPWYKSTYFEFCSLKSEWNKSSSFTRVYRPKKNSWFLYLLQVFPYHIFLFLQLSLNLWAICDPGINKFFQLKRHKKYHLTEHLSASLNLQDRLLSLFILIIKCVCLCYERNKIYTIHIHLHVANGRPLPKSRLICALYDRVEEFDTILVRFRASKNLLLADSAQKNLSSTGM